MIVKNSYFINSIYIPHAETTVSSTILDEGSKVQDFINTYERECLIKSLGFQLFTLLNDEFKFDEVNLLKPTADAKWDDLVNGKSYTNSDSKAVKWRGIRFKNEPVAGDYDMSFLAFYIYYFFEQDNEITRSGVGSVKTKAKNADTVSGSTKAISAWRKFVEMVQGKSTYPSIIEKRIGFGIDWYGDGGTEVSLYQFINDMNDDTADTYPDFTPKSWVNQNQFGI